MKQRARKKITASEMKDFLAMQRSEAEAVIIYSMLIKPKTGDKNARVLLQLAKEEKRHYALLKAYTGTDVRPGRVAVLTIILAARILGPTFALKLLERGETRAIAQYSRYRKKYPDVAAIAEDEKKHEYKLIGLLREEKLNYMGSVVLGLNDALVELAGALVGFSFALSSTRLIGIIGLITGISAALSMAASEYLSTRAEGGDNSAVKASVYTGIAYILTVAVLVAPYLVLDNRYLSLGIMFLCALTIIALFNYYYSVVKDESFRARFAEMALLSGGVSLVSFLMGLALKRYTGIDM